MKLTKMTKRIMACGLAFSMVMAGSSLDSITASAAKSAKLSKSKVSVAVGKTQKLTVKNATKKVKWSTSNKKPGYLAAAFLCNYEKAANTGWGAQIKRARIAEKWYQTFTGENPGKWIPPGLICAMKKMTERRC